MLQVEDDGGGLEDKEEDYDALNCETFGSAINGDWENIHENLVRLDRSAEIKDDNGESDLGRRSTTNHFYSPYANNKLHV